MKNIKKEFRLFKWGLSSYVTRVNLHKNIKQTTTDCLFLLSFGYQKNILTLKDHQLFFYFDILHFNFPEAGKARISFSIPINI